MAAGLGGLVMDVKFGTGAFMSDIGDARALARSIVDVANGGGLPTVALLTDMNQPLGRTAGNAVEVREAIDLLTGGRKDERLWEVTARLTAELLVIGGLAADAEAARIKVEHALASGAAAERFARMVRDLGGPADILEKTDRHLPTAPVIRPIAAERDGVVAAVDARAIGVAIVALGGGRTRPEDGVDHAVGLTEIAAIGESVGVGGRPLALLHARDEASAAAAEAAIRAAVTVAGTAPAQPALVAERIA